MPNIIDMDVARTWQSVKSVKSTVENALHDYPKKLRYAAGMAASELVGNAIKYGVPDPGTPPHLTCRITDDQLVIEVTNQVASPDSVHQVTMRIDQMALPGNGEKLFLNRLQEILAGSSQGGQLGLYRISYEGEFDLSYRYADRVLTVTAARGLP